MVKKWFPVVLYIIVASIIDSYIPVNCHYTFGFMAGIFVIPVTITK